MAASRSLVNINSPANALFLLLLWLQVSFTVVDAQVFVEEPSDVSVVVGKPVTLRCRVSEAYMRRVAAMNLDINAVWFRIQTDDADEVTHGEEGRYFMVGSPKEGVFDLFINNTKTEDTGSSYLCLFNKTTTRSAVLTVLPRSWSPTCASNPTQTLTLGETLQIACTSSGDRRTTLMWQINGALIDGAQRSVTDKVVSLTHSEEIVSKESLTLVCIASLVGKLNSEVCTLGPFEVTAPAPSAGVEAYIPYIIVGLLSVVVSLLFMTLLVVVFRHRQCRICQRELPEPQTVLDMSQIKPGGPPPFYVFDDDDTSDDGGNVSVGISPPPDVIPTYFSAETVSRMSTKKKGISVGATPSSGGDGGKSKGLQRSRATSQQERPTNSADVTSGAPLRRTLSNSTLQENIDDRSKDKTVTGKKKLTMSKFGGSSGGASSSKKQQRKAAAAVDRAKSSRSTAARAAKARQRGKQLEEEAAVSNRGRAAASSAAIASASAAAALATKSGKRNGASDTRRGVKSKSLKTPGVAARTSKPSMNNLGDNIINQDAIGASGTTHQPEKRSVYKKKPARPVSSDLNNVDNPSRLRTSPELVVDSPQPEGAVATENNITTPGTSASSSAPAAVSSNSSKKDADKVIYASLDFAKPIGMNIQPDV